MTLKPSRLAFAFALALASAGPALAQNVATVNGVGIPKARVDAIVKSQAAQGQPDSEQLRAAVRERLIELEVLAQEANKKGLAKNPDFQQQIELQRQQALANALVQDYIKANPVDDAVAKAEYDKIRTQAGDKEYRARHILVDKEDEAKDIVAKLKAGQKFEDLAKVSKDPGSKDRGGDLDWNSPAAYVKPFSDALVKLQKGQYTMVPVQTQFGWHVILLEDVRATKFPPFDEVKNELKQRIQQQNVAKYVADLRSKAKVQ
ncbi:MAG: peptidylprolyl isomerase [Burkholderiales bacterium]|jgi:peptidyl-prolyl cis-trans isomerase C|nr:peptidylprolyl isomerase [Burkholderiales bacterium]